MGTVYRARDPRLEREVAIKISAEQFSERFDREARAIAALNHPNICQIYDVGPNYLVMELIDGQPLKGPLPLDLALKYGAQICDALDAAHRKGIAHRDLKPANILVTKHGIKLLDFGLAKTALSPVKPASGADETATSVLTGRNEIVGTLHYMSPEQLQARQEADVRTDIFSFGLLLYEMLSGQRAFDGPSPASVIAAIIERPAPSLSAVAPPALDRVVQRCLAKDPDDRWQTARDLRAELQWIAAAPSESAASHTTPTRRGYLVVLLTVLMVAAAAFGAAWWIRRPAAPAPRLKVNLEPPAGEEWFFPSLSPDGTRIAVDTPHGLRVRAVDSLESQAITTSPGPPPAYYPPTWSPDGRSLVYYSGTNTGELRKVSVPGGTPQTLAAGLPVFRGIAWNTDGNILFSAGGRIMRVSENGGTPVPVADRGIHPTMLPDGRHYLFLGGGRGSPEGIYAGSLDSKEQRKITEANSQAEFRPSGHLLFLRGTTLMAQPFDPAGLRTTGEAFPVASDVGIQEPSRTAAFSVSPNGLIVYKTGGVGRTALTWVDRSGKPSGVIDDANFYFDIDVAPNGKAVAATRLDLKTFQRSLWVTDLARGITSRLTEQSEDVVRGATWSPDSKRIAYWSPNQLYVRDATGSGNRESLGSSGGMPHWSPDGKTLVFAGLGGQTTGSLWLLPVGGDHKPVLYLEGQFAQPAFSPDGRWMAYVSAESGSLEVFVQPIPAGHGKWQISTQGGAQPVWRRDGKELFYKSADSKIVAVPVKIGATFEAGVPKELFPVSTTGLFNIRRQYSVSPDGQRFLVNVRVDEHPQTILLQNWLNPVR